MSEFEQFRSALLGLRRDIEDQSASTSDQRAPVTLDQQSVGRLSRMDALQEQAMQQANERRRQNTLKRIDSALARLEDGEYGYCISCGEEIGLERLDNDPAVPTCIKCAGR